jgi:hypothetical protein
MRLWVVPVVDVSGHTLLWIGGTANRNRDAFEHKFKTIVEEIQNQLKPESVASAIQSKVTPISSSKISTIAGR